jgi:hypothetical protein
MALTEEQKIDLLGKNSYSTVVKEIVEKIQKAEVDTLVGNELLKEVYANLNESITPLLTLKPFITGAEKIAGDDVKLVDLVKFMKKRITGNADLNFLINLVKEEHFAEMTRMNHPSPESTIKDIEDQFNKPSSVIEEGIKAGLFDNLKSDLLHKIKNDLNTVKPVQKLNESNVLFSENLVKYSPIGIKLEDIQNNRIVMLTESGVFTIGRETKKFSLLNESIQIPEEHQHLMHAINQCTYSPENNTFSLNENWDFDLLLHPSGIVTINEKEIPKDKVKTLLLESVRTYVTDSQKVENFNKLNYLHDADNFIKLMENSNHLIRLDNLTVIKNLNENSFIILQSKSEKPEILYSNQTINKLFESYSEMVIGINSVLIGNVTKLFENEIIAENKKLDERNSKITMLTESQNSLNINIEKVRNLKKLSAENSPAQEKLDSQETILITKLNENIEELNIWKNEFKLF